VLRHRKDMRPAGLTVPARDPRQPMRDIRDLDIERRGVQQIKPPTRQHPLPDPGGVLFCERRFQRHFDLRRGAGCLPAQVSWQKHVTRWSLTMPVACMKAYTIVGPTNLNPRAASSFEILIESRVDAGTLAVVLK
jgi:hypothetical protein